MAYVRRIGTAPTAQSIHLLSRFLSPTIVTQRIAHELRPEVLTNV